jgi:hypothetical protein
MTTAVRLVVNPANTKQRYVLWGDGRIDNIGGALPIPQATDILGGYGTPAFDQFPGTAGSRPAPLWIAAAQGYGNWIAAALFISDWSGPSGAVLSRWGKVSPFGAMPDPQAGTYPNYFAYPGVFAYDLVMDPSGSACHGYILTNYGNLTRFGDTSGTAPPDLGAADSQLVSWVGSVGAMTARRVVIDWTTKKVWILDGIGRVRAFNPSSGYLNVFAEPSAGQQLWAIDISVAMMFYGTTPPNPKGWIGTSYGNVGAAYNPGDTSPARPLVKGAPNTPGWGADFAITDNGSTGNPIGMAALFINGVIIDWFNTAPPVCYPGSQASPTPANPTTTTTRPHVLWDYNDPDGTAQKQYEVVIYPSSVWNAGGLVNEVWTLTQSGATGGTFTLTIDGQTTAAIAYNATAATVQTALQALSLLSTNVTCAGGPLGTAGVTITFSGGNLAKLPISPLACTANTANTLTGGGVTVVETTKGTAPSLDMTTDLVHGGAGALYQTWGSESTIRQVIPNVNLPNDATGLRAFIRLTSTGLVSSGWRVRQWVQNTTPLPTPTVTPTVVGGTSGTSLAVSAVSLPAGDLMAVQFQDADGDGVTWYWLRNGWSIVSTGGTVVDYEAPFGVVRSYRAMAYTPASAPWNSSPWSTTATATLTPQNMFALTDPLNTALGGKIRVEEPPNNERLVTAGVFYPPGRANAVVISSGPPKGPRVTINVHVLTKTDRAMINNLIGADDPLFYRTPHGERYYAVLSDTHTRKQVLASPSVAAGDTATIRDAHLDTLVITAIDMPATDPDPTVAPAELLGSGALAWLGPPPVNNDQVNLYQLM